LPPETDFINFDQIGNAILTIFQCMTMEGWTDVMYYIQDAVGFWVSTIYFFTLIPATSFFMLNVALAVVDEAREDQGDVAHAAAKASAAEHMEGPRLSLQETEPDGDTTVMNLVEFRSKSNEESADEAVEDASQLSPVNNDEVEVKSGTNNHRESFDADPTSHPSKSNMEEGDLDFMQGPGPDDALWYDCRIVRICHAVAFSDLFINSIMFVIAGNIIIMMMETYPPITALQEPMNICENVFLVYFCCEMIILIGALGPKGYVKNPVTRFDGVIVCVSLIQKIVSLTQDDSSDGGSSAFTALRTLRLFRVLNKLASRSMSFRVLLKAMVATGASLRYWGFLFILILYIFTLMWMTFFAKRFHFVDPDSFDEVSADQGEAWCGGVEGNQDCIPRAHFDTFFWGLITIFQVMTGENWNTIMYAGIRSYEVSLRPFIAMLFMFLLLFGQILFLSLFLSMLMSKFDQVQDAIAIAELQKQFYKRKRLTQVFSSSKGGLFTSSRSKPKEVLESSARSNSEKSVNGQKPRASNANSMFAEVGASGWIQPLGESGDIDDSGGQLLLVDADEPAPKESRSVLNRSVIRAPQEVFAPIRDATGAKAPSLGTKEPVSGEVSRGASKDQTAQVSVDSGKRSFASPTVQDPGVEDSHQRRRWPHGYAWFFLSEDCLLRKGAIFIVEYEATVSGHRIKVFDNFILLCILIASLGMAYDTPLNNPDDRLTKMVRGADLVFAYIFIGEMSIKLVALGLIWGKDAYLRNGWNLLDGVVVIVSVIGLVSPGSGGFLKTLRILRAFRPLRVISRNENLKVVVQTMFASLPDLLTLICVTAFFLLIFALFFLSFLNGRLYQCESPVFSGDEGVKMSRDLGVGFTTPMCLGSNATDQACPRGRYQTVAANQAVWTDAELTCREALGRSYCPHDNVPLTVPWQRATWDTPICIGRCNPAAQAKDNDLWKNRGWLCEADFTSVAELPSACQDADSPQYLASMTTEEQRGRRFVEQITRQLVMPCGGATVDASGALSVPPEAAAVSCRKAFCPGEASDDKKKECKATCEIHPHFCQEACRSGSSSAECQACRNECEAQCQCADFCEPLIKDAALCHEQGGRWVHSLSQNFDNAANALLTLFEIMSTEGWVDVMYAAADSTGYYMQPRRDASSWIAPFFAFYIFISFMFLLNLSVGVIVDKFMDLKQEGKDSLLLTDAQQKWVNSKKKLFRRNNYFDLVNLHLLPPFRRNVYNVVTHRQFENVIMAALCLNASFMLMKIFPLPTASWDDMLEVADVTFAVVFLVELVAKFFALRSAYWQSSWNRFDAFCVFVSITGLLLGRHPSMAWVGSATSIVRVFRIGRLFRFFEGMNKIFMALVMSIPKLANVIGILLLLLVLFSILGVSLFSTAKHGETFAEHAHFKTVINAFITLFRASTGEAWNEIMHDLSKTPEDFWRAGSWCTPTELFDPEEPNTWRVLDQKCLIANPNSCVAPWEAHIAVAYWVAYTLIITYMVMNLVVAVILEGYDDGKPTLETEIVERCVRVWKRYDPDQTLALPYKDGLRFIHQVVTEVLSEMGGEGCGQETVSNSRNQLIGDDIAAVNLKLAAFWRNLPVTAESKVTFLESTKLVLRFTVAVHAMPEDSDLGEGMRIEALMRLGDDKVQLRPGSVGTLRKLLPSGDMAIHWDEVGERWLSAKRQNAIAPLPLHRLLEDVDNIEDKMDRRYLESLRRLEEKRRGQSLRRVSDSSNPDLHVLDMRQIMACVKIQRVMRARIGLDASRNAGSEPRTRPPIQCVAAAPQTSGC